MIRTSSCSPRQASRWTALRWSTFLLWFYCLSLLLLIQEGSSFLPMPRRFQSIQQTLTFFAKSTGRSSRIQSQLFVVGKSGGKVLQSAEQYAELVLEPPSSESKQTPVLVFWTAPWCGPCRLSSPVVRDVYKQFSGKIQVVEICTDDLPEVAADAGVVSIPTIQIWCNGELKDTIIGCVAKSVLASAVEKNLEDLAAAQAGARDSGNRNDDTES